jgi:UDP-N-acetylmuramoyl-tripeptide--D-alanyl-D-alanine ligase
LHTSTTQLRLMIVRAENGAMILDDSYNSSPESTLAALNLLDELEGRKVAVLGDMLELGPYEEQGHELVGKRASEVVNELVTVGERGRIIANAALKAGLPASATKDFSNTQEAIEYLRERLHDQDVVLVKGSHAMRMDLIVAALEARQ